MSDMWFTRASLRRDAPDVAPLIKTLLPTDDDGKLANATHRLLWTLMDQTMQEEGKTQRDDQSRRDQSAFLWRQAERENCWYVLGPRPRKDNAFFDVETKPYHLGLVAGDRLSFDLRVNATVNRMIDPDKGRRKGRQRCDIVMDAMKAEEQATGGKDRPARRDVLARQAVGEWLEVQGNKHGFRLDAGAFTLVSHQTIHLDKPTARPRGKTVLIGISSITGLLEITDPGLFAAKVVSGFGRAKAFGLGLMLLRRAN